MKLKWKFTLLLTIMFTTIFISSALVTSMRVDSSNRKLTENLSTQLIRSKANEAGGWLGQRIRELHTISRTPTVVSMEEGALKAYINQLSADMDSYYGNDYGTFGINNFNGLEYITDYQTIDVSDRSYFKEMLVSDAEFIISEPIVSKTDQNLITVACYPIFNEVSEKIGFVAASISLDKLTQITDNLSFYNGKSLILDKGGNIYTHTDNKLSAGLINDLAANIPETLGSAVVSADLKEADIEYTAFYATIPNSPDWYLCTVVHKSELFKDTRLLTSSLAGIWVAMLIMGISASFMLSHIVTKRITILSTAMDGIKSGNLDTSINVRGNDEISKLARSFNYMVIDIRRLMDEVYETQRQKRQKELQVLQAQINPHFIYNTLDTLQWKALEHDATEVAALIMSLSSFFRISLSGGNEVIQMDKELEHVRSYLEIQKQRYDEILEYDISCDPDLLNCLLPKIIIQPLVENALYHGIKPKLTKGLISISVAREANDMIISVKDDGVGIPQEKLEKIRKGLEDSKERNSYGLYNVSQRISLYFGKSYCIRIDSSENEGTTVRILLPIIREDENDVQIGHLRR